ncbi:hypothetical protein MTO96_022097 [Rhipicephalus appendiculatus]
MDLATRKWSLLALASVLSVLDVQFGPHLNSYNKEEFYDAYDYVIVGGGAAGCLLANRLSRDPSRSVLLVEAGGIEDATIEVPLLALLHFRGPYDWDYRTEPQKNACLGHARSYDTADGSLRCRIPRGKGLGGSSLINFQMYVRGNRRDFDLWEKKHGAIGWSYKDVLPYFKKYESFKNAAADQESWINYVEGLEPFFEANDVTSDSKKSSILISVLNPETYAPLRSLLAPRKPKDGTSETIVRVLTQHLSPKPLEIYETFRFQTRVQNSGESVADHLAKLQKIADHCGFDDALEKNLRDRFVIGLREKGVQRPLLAKPRSLTWKDALDTALAAEFAISNASRLPGSSDTPAATTA